MPDLAFWSMHRPNQFTRVYVRLLYENGIAMRLPPAHVHIAGTKLLSGSKLSCNTIFVPNGPFLRKQFPSDSRRKHLPWTERKRHLRSCDEDTHYRPGLLR